MKTKLYIYFPLLVTLFAACNNEDIVVTYPDSKPIFEQSVVTGISEKYKTDPTKIDYNDSIALNVVVSDKIAPLSTLEIMVAVNNEVLHAEKVRTKGNYAEINRKYSIPFGVNMPDNVQVEVYLTSTNVSGFTAETLLNTVTVYRPIKLTELYIVPIKGETYKLIPEDPTDPNCLIFKASGMKFPNNFSYRIANKVNMVHKINWAAPGLMAFGNTAKGIGIITEANPDNVIEVNDPSIFEFTDITFNALSFTATLTGTAMQPITELDVKSLTAATMGKKDVLTGLRYLGKDTETTFTGISHFEKGISSDFFKVTGTNKAKFLGETGTYRIVYFKDADFLYVDKPGAKYPDALYICGNGFGLPTATATATSSWNWNSPLDYLICRKVEAGIYQVTLFIDNKADTEKPEFGSLNFKFFHEAGWDKGETNAEGLTIKAPLIGRVDEKNVGNFGTKATPFSGIYRITLNLNDKTTNIEKIN